MDRQRQKAFETPVGALVTPFLSYPQEGRRAKPWTPRLRTGKVAYMAIATKLGHWALAAAGFALLSGTGCQRGEVPREWKQSALGRDVDRICHVMKYSGAEQEGQENHAYMTAQWLGENLESGEGRDFLVEIAQLDATRKVQRLEAKAQQLGVTECPTVAMWRAPAAATP